MLENQGIFSLAVRSEATVSLARNVQLAQGHIRAQVTAQASVAVSAYRSSASLTGVTSAYADLMTNTTISPAAKLKAFLKDVLDKTDDNLISDDMMKRLEKASKSDNKEISAQKLQQAKAKLQALRAQAQLAAASGDAKTLRRIAMEVAQAAREIASAVRGLASGIAATAETADGSGSGSTPTALGATDTPQQGDAESAATAVPEATAAAANSSDAPSPQATDGQPAGGQPTNAKSSPYTGPVPNGENPLTWGRDALRKLSDDAHAAIAQAKGLIAFLAQAARAARKHRPDPEEDKAYGDLARSVSDADADVSSAICDATQEMTDGATPTVGDTGMDSAAGIGVDVTAIAIETTVTVTVTTGITA
jgi:hypothetical protein